MDDKLLADAALPCASRYKHSQVQVSAAASFEEKKKLMWPTRCRGGF
jgi:hypothetical protein